MSRTIKSKRASISPLDGLDFLRALCDCSFVLVDDSSSSGILAEAQRLAVPHIASSLGRIMDCLWRGDFPLAQPRTLRHLVGVASCRNSFLDRNLAVSPFRRQVQLVSTRWIARVAVAVIRPATRDLRTAQSRPPSHLFGAFMRNAGLESGIRPHRLRWVDGVCRRDRRDHDLIGGQRVAVSLWRRI